MSEVVWCPNCRKQIGTFDEIPIQKTIVCPRCSTGIFILEWEHY